MYRTGLDTVRTASAKPRHVAFRSLSFQKIDRRIFLQQGFGEGNVARHKCPKREFQVICNPFVNFNNLLKAIVRELHLIFDPLSHHLHQIFENISSVFEIRCESKNIRGALAFFVT